MSRTEAIIAESEESLSRYVSAEETQRVSSLLEEKRRTPGGSGERVGRTERGAGRDGVASFSGSPALMCELRLHRRGSLSACASIMVTCQRSVSDKMSAKPGMPLSRMPCVTFQIGLALRIVGHHVVALARAAAAAGNIALAIVGCDCAKSVAARAVVSCTHSHRPARLASSSGSGSFWSLAFPDARMDRHLGNGFFHGKRRRIRCHGKFSAAHEQEAAGENHKNGQEHAENKSTHVVTTFPLAIRLRCVWQHLWFPNLRSACRECSPQCVRLLDLYLYG